MNVTRVAAAVASDVMRWRRSSPSSLLRSVRRLRPSPNRAGQTGLVLRRQRLKEDAAAAELNGQSSAQGRPTVRGREGWEAGLRQTRSVDLTARLGAREGAREFVVRSHRPR